MNATQILESATNALADRAKSRDTERERSMGKAVAIFNEIRRKGLTEADGWYFMIALKLARSQQGGFNIDDFVDLAGYAALAGEHESDL